MPRLRCYLPPLLLLLPVLFICGKLLLTPVRIERKPLAWERRASIFVTREEMLFPFSECRGWPWVYSKKLDPDLAPLIIITSKDISPEITWGVLAADLAVAALLVTLAVALLRWHYRRQQAWLRISLRGLLIGVALCALAFGWITHHTIQWKREQQALAQFGYLCRGREQYCGPEWLRRLWPADDLAIFNRATSIQIDSDDLSRGSIDDLIVVLHATPYAAEVLIGSWPGQRQIFEPPAAEIRQQAAYVESAGDRSVLSRVKVTFDRLDSKRAAILRSWSSHLRALELRNCEIDHDETLDLIDQLTSLEEFSVELTQHLSDAIFAPLPKLQRLRTLEIWNPVLSEEAVEYLQKLPALEDLSLHGWFGNDEVRLLLPLEHLKSLTITCRGILPDETVRLLKAKIPQVTVKMKSTIL